ncbi:hypothetical protein VSR68_19065 [Paraburkholderia phymatum]|uniref:hypothetical protein n=1 Tax=Paraburkholderia phymatum TaxID=148447 RepID=UPI0031797D22
MGKYFLRDSEIAEPDAANAWFAYAESHGIDIPKAISIWEDAATEEGAGSRRLVEQAGIRIDVSETGHPSIRPEA